ncbi:SAM-dependent methyltransferase [Kutzneria sp. CA-103260]|uniref:SAM-dependent methyltransferase n=1 Tax=Kutzneria sp. CA-103260 TaxID=2802641 RepID=UPI002011CC7C|nr:SAM-dependent methyltransferase [Kutzneria sp. CA-103260]
MERPAWAPREVDIEKASAARLYDYFLGGSYNFEVDRALGRQIEQAAPGVPQFAFLNRSYLRRAVCYLLSRGVDQFLDLGSGIPTAGNVHEIAQNINPDAKVVYVDNEPVAVAHADLLLEDNPNAVAIEADLADTGYVLGHEKTRGLLDFSRPIGLLAVAVLHFLPPGVDPLAVLAEYRRVLSAGSYLALSHLTHEVDSDQVNQITRLYAQSQNPIQPRGRGEIIALFTGFDLVEPGVVFTPVWHPESPEDVGEHPDRSGALVGVGRKA